MLPNISPIGNKGVSCKVMKGITTTDVAEIYLQSSLKERQTLLKK